MYISLSGRHTVYHMSQLIYLHKYYGTSKDNFNSSIILSRHLRNKNSEEKQQKNPENVDEHVETTRLSKTVYDQVEENSAYQELGETTKESQYDKLK